MNRNTIICALNSQYIHSSLAPWCLMAGINAYGTGKIEANVLESTVNERAEITLEKITEEKPKYIGFSCYIWNIARVQELLPMVKERLPESVIILGGPEVSYNSRAILMEIPEVDYIISGEGERPFTALVEALISQEEIPKDMGISYMDGQKLIIAEPYVTMEEPPTPYTNEYFENLGGRISYMESSRGCPFSCAFCLSGRCGKARFFDLDRTYEEIILLAKSGTKTIKFVDRTFNANKDRAKKIVAFITENYGKEIPAGVCFHFEIAGDILDDELIELLGKAPVGSIQLEIGLQSFNKKTLEAVTRKTDTNKLKQNITALLANQNIHIHIDLIAGLPFEGMESFRDSFNTAFRLNANMLQMGFLKILHGAPMDLEPEKYPCEYSKTPPYEVISTPWLTANELKELHFCEFALDKLYCSGRFLGTVEFLIAEADISPFDFFMDFGKFAKESKTPYDLCRSLMEYGKQRSVDCQRLRDILTTDWISTNSSGKLPEAIYIPDRDLKLVSLLLESNPNTKRPQNTKRIIAILYSEGKALWVDYNEKHPVTGRYRVHEIENYKKLI